MFDHNKYLDTFREYTDFHKNIRNKLSSSDFDFSFEKINEYAKALFTFCPFKPGDRVELKKIYEVPKGSGWYSSRETFKGGAKATVKYVDWNRDDFEITIMFDREYCALFDGSIIEIREDRKHVWYFKTKWLKKAVEERQELVSDILKEDRED